MNFNSIADMVEEHKNVRDVHSHRCQAQGHPTVRLLIGGVYSQARAFSNSGATGEGTFRPE
jgi:hypothetical protein